MYPIIDEIASALGRPEILSALVIDRGQNNLVLDTGELIVRIPRHNGAQADLQRETQVLATLRSRLPLPIPNTALMPLASGTVVAMHTKLPGTALVDIADVSHTARQRLVDNLTEFLLALHRLPVDILGSADESDNSLYDWYGLLVEVDAKVLPLLSTHGADSVRARFEKFLASNSEPHPRVVIHGDFGTGNILIDNGKVTGIIDFASCAIGDPAYDLASLSAGLGDDIFAMMGRSYPGIDAMRERISFYRSTFRLLDVLFGLEHGDINAFNAGLETLRRG